MERIDPESPRTSATSAAVVATSFARALLDAEPARAAAYFAPTGRCLTPDGTEVVGRESIADLLAQLTSSTQRLEISSGRTILADRVALATQYWTRSSPQSGEDPFRASSLAWLVLERAGHGWQIAIASPWG